MKLSHLALSVLFLLPLSSKATTISPFGCVGLQSPACPGTIDTFSGDPGMLLASSSVAMYYVDIAGTPFHVGDFLSAAYREQPNTDGHFTDVTFYYQFRSLANMPQAVGGMDVIPPSGLPYPVLSADVGIRQGAISAPGFTTSPASIDWLEMQNIGTLVLGFNSTPVNAGQSSAILEVRSGYQYYVTGGIGGVSTIPDSRGNGTAYTGMDNDMNVLLPANVPEPASVALVGLPLLLLGLARYRQPRD